MTAKEMFEEMGFERTILIDGRYVFTRTEITFIFNYFSKIMEVIFDRTLLKRDDDTYEDFIADNLNIIARDVNKAIHQQKKELGWI